MCLLCGTSQPTTATSFWSEGRIDPTMMFTEGTDVGETTGTAQALAIGDEAYGSIANGTDEDWYAIQVVSGQTYHINLVGDPTGGTAILDTTVQLFDNTGAAISVGPLDGPGFNDDGGYGLYSYLSYVATYTGTVYVQADGYDSFETGDYILSVYLDDIAGSTATQAVVLVNSNVTGQTSSISDEDWYAVTLAAGQTYTFTQLAGDTGGYTSPDLNLYTSAGGLIDADTDNDGVITYTATAAGTYYVGVGAATATSGSYNLVVDSGGGGGGGGWETPDLTEPLASIDWGFTAPTTINVYFAPGGLSFIDTEGSYTTVAWTAQEMAGAEVAFQQFENVANVTFNTVGTAASADFIMVQTDGTGALGYWGVGGGSITLGGTAYNLDGWGVFEATGTGFDDTGTQQGGYGFITLIHEIGHGMGLAHPHDNGGSSSIMEGVTGPFGSYGTYGLNQGIWTTMSYNDGWVTGPIGASPSNDYGWQATMMTLDVAVLQDTYGANTTYNSGNNIYTLPSTNAAGTFYSAIWDTGGTDTIRHVGAAGAIINLNAAPLTNTSDGGGYVSYVGGIHGGFTIANGVVIENATGGSGADTIAGNSAANTLDGQDGDDTINGNGGNDTLAGGSGSDTLDGGDGGDALFGGADIDQLIGGNGNDNLYVVGNDSLLQGDAGYDQAIVLDVAGVNIALGAGVEYAAGNIGNDTISAASLTTAVTIGGGAGTDTLTGGSAGDTLAGSDGNDILVGNGGNDIIFGGTGAESFDGGDGDDKMYIVDNDASIVGGAGFDQAIVLDAAGVNITLGLGIESASGNSGADVINASGLATVVSIGGGGGNDILTGGSANDTLAGQIGNDTVFGGGGADTLFGGDGNDQLYGGAGNDSMTGGNGIDTFYFLDGSGNDFIQSFVNGQDFFNFANHTLVNSMANVTITDVGADAYVTLNGGGQVLVFGGAGLVDAGDFLF